MKTEIKSAINLLAGKITEDIKADEALKFTQAALNLAHTEATIENTKAGYADMRSVFAQIARNACLVPPDGGAPTAEERELCDLIAQLIMAYGG